MTNYAAIARPIMVTAKVMKPRFQPSLKRKLEATLNSYRSAHRRVKRSRGVAAAQLCINFEKCGSFADHWSLNHDAPGIVHGQTPVKNVRSGTRYLVDVAWSNDINAYSPRCAQCHEQYDDTPQRRAAKVANGKKIHGRKYTVADLLPVAHMTRIEQAKAIGCSTGTVDKLRHAMKNGAAS